MSRVPLYFPQFLYKFWLSDVFTTTHSPDGQRFHIYDVHNNELTETRRIPQRTRNVFEDFANLEALDEHCQTSLQIAELAFSRLEAKAELALTHLMQQVLLLQNRTKTVTMELERDMLETLRSFFVFLRYRNSVQYSLMLSNLVHPDIRRRHALANFQAFLHHDTSQSSTSIILLQDVARCFQNFLGAEICLGVASEGQEFVLTDDCTGNLDESFRDDPDSCRFFVPLSPTVSLYILGDLKDEPNPIRYLDFVVHHVDHDSGTVRIDCILESVSDVHLRNTVLLQHRPDYIYFSNLLSIARTINLYETGSRNADEHSDYSRLMHRCQQKATQEEVTKTLVVKGSIAITDLTDHVVRVGDAPKAHGSFSDVWAGTWCVTRPFAKTEHRKVALKFLRQVMPDNIREKLVKRLKDEVVTWHTLCHENIAQLFGIIQSCNSIAMVSPWCDNGTLIHYLKEINPSANRLELLVQVGSGVSYLHDFRPIVVHGDLKGVSILGIDNTLSTYLFKQCNILVDDSGKAIITDFGLAKVVEEFSDSMQLATSFFAGSTRWMAPELILALVEDDQRPPPITTHSDVYAFGCICLEIATGELPFPHRTNDYAVTVDIMRGVRPSRGTSCHVQCHDQNAFWAMLDKCWDAVFYLRPSMLEITSLLRNQTKSLVHHIPFTSGNHITCR